jgi:ribosome maturation factor RimP
VTDVAAIAKQIEPEVKSLGYELVRVAMIGGTSDPTLQVMAERPDTRQLDPSPNGSTATIRSRVAFGSRSARRASTAR